MLRSAKVFVRAHAAYVENGSCLQIHNTMDRLNQTCSPLASSPSFPPSTLHESATLPLPRLGRRRVADSCSVLGGKEGELASGLQVWLRVSYQFPNLRVQITPFRSAASDPLIAMEKPGEVSSFMLSHTRIEATLEG